MKKLKWVIFICLFTFVCLFALICSGPAFEIEYYEKVTKIKFPTKYNVVATADNVEYVTITILDIDKTDCKKFIIENNFKLAKKEYWHFSVGKHFLDSSYFLLPNTDSSFIRSVGKVPGKVGWTYLIDTTNCRLYCEINYPDWGGN